MITSIVLAASLFIPAPLAITGPVRTVPGTTRDYHGFPSMVKHGNTLFMVWRKGSMHASYDGVIMSSTSTNSGRSWSSPKTLLSSRGYDYRDPSISKTDNGMFLLSFFRRKIGEPTRAYVRRSYTAGRTWYAPAPVSIGAMAVSSPTVEMGGNLYQAAYSAGNAYLYWSRDRGVTWSVKSVILANGNYTTEPWLIKYRHGREGYSLVVIVRDDTSRRAQRLESFDEGYSWTRPRSIFYSDSRVAFMQASDGNTYAFYRARNRQTIRTRASSNGFLTWSVSRYVHRANTLNNYVAFAETSPGRFSVVVAQGQGNHRSVMYSMFARA